MPENVGVLQLEIRDNSTEAGQGLTLLATALSKVQTAVGNGLNLAGISAPLNKFAKSINEHGSGKTLQSVGTFLKALADYKKGFSEANGVKFNAEPIAQLKAAIGDGIKLGQAGTQIKNIREALAGEWNEDNAYKAGRALAAIGEGARSIPDGLDKKADHIKRVAEALREYTSASAETKRVLGDRSEQMQQLADAAAKQQEWFDQGGFATGKRMPLNLQFFAGNGGEKVTDTVQELESVNEMLKDTDRVVHNITDSFTAYNSSLGENANIVKDANLDKYLVDPITSLRSRIAEAEGSLGSFGTNLNAVTPKLSEASIESVVATKNIEMMVNRLNTPIRYRGFSQLVDQLNGVNRSLIDAKQSAETFTKAPFEYFNSQLKDTDTVVENIKEEMQEIKNPIDLTKIPASGLAGAFKTAAEEVEHITKQIDEQKLSLSQWEQVYEKTQKAIKYNGSTQERTSMLGHAEEGFYSAYEKLNEYDRLLNQVLEHANNYSKTAAKPIEAVTEAVGHAMEKVEGYGTGGIRELYASTNELGRALRGELGQVERLKAITKVSEGTGLSKGEINKQLIECRENADKARQSVESLLETLNKPIDKINWANSIDRMQGIGAEVKSAEESAQAFASIDESANRNSSVISRLKEKYDELKNSISETLQSAGGMSGIWRSFGSGIKSMFPTLTGMVKRLGAIAKYRFLRSVIRHITSGFSEGLKNVYEYSKAVGGTFAPAMDSAASAIATMKNSLGAALAPAIQAVIPYVNQLVNWFINLVNYANQFFALLAGQSTWTRALPATANAFDKQKKAAKGAGNAIKDLLADWDELNIIQSEAGGGGGGAAQNAEDYLKMFEEVGKFDNKIKDTVKFIQSNMKDIIDIIKDAGIALLGWKFSKAFTGPLAAVGALIAAGKIMEITWKLTGLFDNEFIKTGDEGWIVKDALTNMFGAALAGAAVETVLGGGTGLIPAGVTLVVSGGISYGIALANAEADKAEVLRQLGLIKLGIGLAAMSVGFGIASGSALIGVALGVSVGAPMFVLTAAVTTVVEQIKTAKQVAKEAFTGKHEGAISVKDLYDALNDELRRQSQGYSLVIDAFAEVPELKVNLTDAAESIAMFTGVINGDGKLTQEEAEAFKKAWTTVFDSMKGITSDTFSTVFNALNISLTSENEEIRKQAKELRISLLMIQNNISEGIAEAELEMKDLADKVSLGNATDVELEKYQKYVEALAKYSNTSFENFNNVIANATHVDFQSMDEVNEYIGTITSSYQSLADEIDTGVSTALEALNEGKKLTEFRHDIGQIGDEEYKATMAFFAQTEENITKAADDRKSSMQKSVQEAYNSLLESALQNLNDIPLDDKGRHNYLDAIAYIYDYIEPIAKAIVDAGGEIDEDLARALMINVSPDEEFNKVAQGLLENNKLDLSIADYIRKFYGDVEPEATPSNDPLDKFIENIAEFERGYANVLKGLDNTTAEYAKRVGENLKIDGENTYDEHYTPEYSIESPMNADNPVDVPVQITVDPVIDVDDLYQQIREKILNSDMSDTSVPLGQTFNLWENDEQEVLQELRNKIDQVGIEYAFDMLTNFLNGDGWTLGKTNTPSINGKLPVAPSMSANGAFLNGSETVKTEAADPSQEASNVESGVRKGNKPLEDLLDRLIAATNRNADRPITISLFPSSTWGFHGKASDDAYEKVTGSV